MKTLKITINKGELDQWLKEPEDTRELKIPKGMLIKEGDMIYVYENPITPVPGIITDLSDNMNFNGNVEFVSKRSPLLFKVFQVTSLRRVERKKIIKGQITNTTTKITVVQEYVQLKETIL